MRRGLVAAAVTATLLLAGCEVLFAEDGDATDVFAPDAGSPDVAGSDTPVATGTLQVPGMPVVQVPVQGSYPSLVLSYAASVGELHAANKDFIDAYHAYVTGSPASTADFNARLDAYTAAGERWFVAYATLHGLGEQFASFPDQMAGKADGPILTLPLPSPATAINVGQLIGNTKEKRAEIEKLYQQGQIDDNAYIDALNQLKKEQLLETAGTGLAAGSGILGGFTIKAGLTLAGATGGVVVGGAILGGIAVGVGVKLLWNYCSGGKKDGGYSGETCALGTWEGKVGDVAPMQFPGQGTLIIQVDGYPPVALDDFGVEGGKVVEIDFQPGDPTTGGGGTVTTRVIDPSELGTCDAIVGISAHPVPDDPAEYEDVVVYATTIPAVAGCAVSFTVSGTDGYSSSGTPTTDATGTASYTIPGGAEDVVDTVVISAGVATYTVVYTF